VTDALKLVTPFNGDKREVLAFTANVDTAFEVTHPRNTDTIYKFVLMRISGEPRTAIAHRNLGKWEELKQFLKNTYIEKRALDYHANQLFSAKKSKSEAVSEWIQMIQKLGSKFREAALHGCEADERAGILTLAGKFRNICFVQGLYSERLQTIVISRYHENFDEIADTASEEESAIISKFESYRNTGSQPSSIKCSSCGKEGHIAAKCYRKERKDITVSRH
jgi:hypothetical protein